MIRALLAGLLAVWPLAADPVRCTVELRDGSRLAVDLPDGEISLSTAGSTTPHPYRLSEIGELRLADERPGEGLARVTALVAELGDARYDQRERAAAELYPLVGRWRELLAHARESATDPEIRSRLQQLLDAPSPPSETGGGFDAVRLALDAPAVYGDAGAWSAEGRRGAVTLRLDRRLVAAIRRGAPRPGARVAAPAGRAGRRIERDEDAEFGGRPVRIDFETDDAGRALTPGTDVSRAFVGRGVRLSTSIAGAIVSVNPYDVGARSRGLSCATHHPLWEGQIAIQFCLPGRPEVAAGVRRVGFHVAAVSPKGTALHAYDAAGRLLLTVPTTRSGSDFLALACETPIHRIVVVPDPAIDPNYTIDDLVFDEPQPVDFLPLPDRWALELHSGERVHAGAVALTDGRLTAGSLAFGLPEFSVAPDELMRLIGPSGGWEGAPRPGECWALLSDGSVVRAEAGAAGPRLARFALTLSPPRLVALWGEGTVLAHPRSAPPPGVVVEMVGHDERRHPRWALGGRHIELIGREVRAVELASAPPLWWALPAEPAPCGWLTLASGERLALGPEARLVGWSAGVLRIAREGRTAEIPQAELMCWEPDPQAR